MNNREYKLTDDELEDVFGGAFKGETMRYVVVGGDTLERIALKFNTTADTLAELNGLKNRGVRPGQILTVPN